MRQAENTQEFQTLIGENIKSLRLQKNLVREMLAHQAGVSVTALRHLESGQGATLTTLIRVVRALGRENWLLNLAPEISVNPLHMLPSRHLRQRARRRKGDRGLSTR